MQPKLQTFKECRANMHLFKEFKDYNVSSDGMFAYDDGKELLGFVWVSSTELHRLDGPAMINWDECNQWYFLGEAIDVNSQSEFDEQIAIKMLTV